MNIHHPARLGLIMLSLIAVLFTLGAPMAPAAAKGKGGDPHVRLTNPEPPVIPANPLPNVAMPTIPSAARVGSARAPQAAAPQAAAAVAITPTLDMRVLVISATSDETNDVTLPAIKQLLDYTGTPYTVWIASAAPGTLTPDKLATTNHGYYNAVFLTSSNLAYSSGGVSQSALNATEWANLWAYEAAYKVRQVSWYTFPTLDYGFSSYTTLDTTSTPTNLSLTTSGRLAFPELVNTAVVTLRNAYTYPATLAASTATMTNTALLQGTVKGKTYTFASTSLYADGRENLALTFSGNQYLVHTIALSYGLLNWATRGVFVGEFRTYAQPQFDDYFIENDLWATSNPNQFPACGTNLDTNPTGIVYRMNSADVKATVDWQNKVRATTTGKNLRISMVFNGLGADPASAGGDAPANDTLVPATKTYKSNFFWVNHTYTHLLLNDPLTPTLTFQNELTLNQNLATKGNTGSTGLALPNYVKGNLVTPEISGLTNQNFLNTAYTWGIRWVVLDTSRSGGDNPSPNVGIPNPLKAGIYGVPRRPANLFYNVSKPAEWTAEYNCLYNSYWGRNLSTAEIIDKESDNLLLYMLRGEIDPWMFHQSNLRAYDGIHSLFSDLMDATFVKYNKLYKLPVQSLNLNAIGQKMKDRAAYNLAGVTSTLTGKVLTITTTGAATVPLVGVCADYPTLDAYHQMYNKQCVISVPFTTAKTVSLTLP